MAQLERYSLILTLCEPFSLFHQIIDSLFFCDNVLHKLEILYSSAAVHSLVLSLFIAPNFITRWHSLIKFCIRVRVNIVQTLACVTVSFDRQGFAEHQSGGQRLVSINAHKS